MNSINMNVVNMIIDAVMNGICSHIDYNAETKCLRMWSESSTKGNSITLREVTPETYAKAMEAFDSYA